MCWAIERSWRGRIECETWGWKQKRRQRHIRGNKGGMCLCGLSVRLKTVGACLCVFVWGILKNNGDFQLESMWLPWQTQSNASPCIPQTEGGGSEINRAGDRGGDLARWNRFIIRNCSSIFPLSHSFWSLPLVQVALREFIPKWSGRTELLGLVTLNYSWCPLSKTNRDPNSLYNSTLTNSHMWLHQFSHVSL